MRENDPPPEHLRCKRTDGRQWRCKRRAMDGKTLCDIHHLQGKHRQNKEKVPDSLKLERKVTKKRRIGAGETSKVPRVSKLASEKTRSEALDEALKRMKLKKGDLHLELIRVFLKRQVEKKKAKESERDAVDEDRTEEFQLPYGVMAVSQSPVKRDSDGLDVKVGAESNGCSFLQRDFRSKNIEPLPVGTMQVVPFADIVKKRMKKCHWCRESKNRCFVKCLTCRKRFFCVECIKDRNFEKQEVKTKCPACHGTCSCMLCKKLKYGVNNDKECSTSEKKLDRIQSLQYIIHLLLPVLKQLNRDQSMELETEAKITGKKQPEIQIPQTKVGLDTSISCSRCKTSIVDYHRTCTKCSYNLCLCCCRELSRHGLYESFKLKSCKKRKLSPPDDEKMFKPNMPSQNSLQNWEVRPDGSIPCPPIHIGGCGETLLYLRSTFPFALNADLEVRAEEVLCTYDFPESAEVSLPCSLCNNIDSQNGEVKPLRIGFPENYLYCPTLKDLRQETVDHFQNHWSKGHPVIVRNMLRSTSSLCWDPVSMFCFYMESKCSGSCNGSKTKATNCLDWCEVEINRKRIFMGSLEKRTHASMKQKFLKFKFCLSSNLFEKQFPIHYNEILSALPLKEYIDPMTGLLNVGVKLPKESPKPDLGPCIYFSYGGPDELSQADFLTKLRYDAHDTVNILAYAMDLPASPEQISTVESLLKKHKGQNHQGQTFSNSSDQKGKSSLQSEDTGESGLQDVGEKTQLPNGTKNIPLDSVQGQTSVGNGNGNGNLSEDSDSDSDASILFSGSIDKSEDVDEFFQGEDIESSISSEDKRESVCGAQWDIFRRQDVPKLLEYLKKHSSELTQACSYTKLVHPILDQNYFLDAYHKLRLKQEFDIEPWTFEQCAGEAIFIPAGCPYQVRKVKSCVNVVLEFISPENLAQCIQLRDEIRVLPTWHKAQGTLLEVEKMALHGISAAVDDFRDLMHVVQGQKVASASSRSKDRRLFEDWLKQHNSKLIITPVQQQQQQQKGKSTSSRPKEANSRISKQQNYK